MSERASSSAKRVLGWVSGTVALISLILGVAALNASVQSWWNTRANVSQLVAGANEARALRDFRQATRGYRDASLLDDTSPELRAGRTQLALDWLRVMPGDIRPGESYPTLVEQLLPDLYMALTGATSHEQSMLWSHIGWAQHIAQMGRQTIPIRHDVASRIDGIYNRASGLDPDNFYTPIYRGYLDIDGYGDVTAAALEFSRGIELARSQSGADSPQFRWAREMTLRGTLQPLGAGLQGRLGYSRTSSERALLLLKLINDMRNAGENLPADPFISELFSFYRSGVGDNAIIENILAALPQDEHLQTLDWLLESEEGQRWLAVSSNRVNLLLVVAILSENTSRDGALELYRDLLKYDWVDDGMAIRIEEGIARLSGEQPARMVKRLGRSYANDPAPDEGDIRAFHLETLMNFDPIFQPENSETAFQYFHNLAQSQVDDAALRDALHVRDRLLTLYRTFKRDVDRSGYSSGRSAVGEIIVTRNLLQAHHWVALQQLARGDTDKVLAELADAQAICTRWVPAWIFKLRTRALSRRGTPGDIEQSADNLQRYIQASVQYGGALDWSDVKSQADYASLRKTSRYSELMRGR